MAVKAHQHDGPVLPDYSGPNVSGIVPALLGPNGSSSIPSWFPIDSSGARSVVLLVLDGLGWNQLQAHRHLMPTLSSCAGGAISTVAPTTTATALTSITTGLTPAEHGVLGYRIDMGAAVLNVLRWGDSSGDLRQRIPPAQVQPCPPFLGCSVPVISKPEFEGSGFTLAHLAGVRHHAWRLASNIPVLVNERVNAGDSFVYAYYDGIDKVAHERGFGPYYEAELRTADHLVSRIIEEMPAGCVLLVTADHGQVQVGDNEIDLPADVVRHVRVQSGEGRFRWLHARRGSESELFAACQQFSDVAWVVSREEVLDAKWFGPTMSSTIERRVGDVALVAREPVSFDDPAEYSGFNLVCRHGSLTSDEMHVPFLGFAT